jgi:predicted ATPase
VDHFGKTALRVSVLRGVEAWSGAVPVEVSGRRLRALVALLALTPGVPRRAEYLADQLWDGDPPSANALQALISRLRRALGAEAVLSKPTGYLLVVDPAAVDLIRFDRLAAEETPAAAREALALAGPEPLAEFTEVPDLADEARRIEAVCRRLQPLAEKAPPAAPARAAAHNSSGLTDRAVLASALISGPPAVPALRLIGRDRLLDEISARLGTTRLLTLVGAGGAGKTSLAKAVAYARGGSVVAELAPVNAESVAAEVLTAVGGREMVLTERAVLIADHRDYRTRVAAAIADRALLLVLDNCEHVVDAAAELATLLLDRCPRVTILTTSREPLSVPGEVRLPVDPLPVPPPGERGDRLGEYAAMQLLVERGRAVRPDLATSGPDAEALAEICRRLDGSPLALELAAARFNALTPRQVADRLDDRFKLLTRGSRTALPRQQTLRAVVDWSWDLLDADERALLAVCAVFVGGAALDDLEVVAQGTLADGDDAEGCVDVLDRLVAKSLVVAERSYSEPSVGAAPDGPPGTGGAMRYRLLETIREYALGRLAESGRENEVRARHARHFADVAEQVDRHIRRHDQLAWIARLDQEEDNVRAALYWSVDSGDALTALRVSAYASWHAMLRGRQDSRGWYRRIVELAETAGETGRIEFAHVYALSAFSALSDGDAASSEEGKARIRRARTLYEAQPGYSTFAVFNEIAVSIFDGTAAHEFRGVLESARRRCREAGDAWGEALVLMVKSRAFADEDMATAERSGRQALELFHRCGDRWGISETVQSLGNIESLRGEHRAAIVSFAEAARVATELGSVGDMVMARVMAAIEHICLDEERAAAEMLDEAEQVAGDRTAEEAIGMVCLVRAQLARRRGDLADAVRHIDRAREIADRGVDAPFKSAYDMSYAAVAADLGNYAESAGHYRTGLASANAFFYDRPEVAGCAEGLAQVALGLGEPRQAARLLGMGAALRPVPLPPGRAFDMLRTRDAVRAALPEADFELEYEDGRAVALVDSYPLLCSLADRYAAGSDDTVPDDTVPDDVPDAVPHDAAQPAPGSD